MPDKINICYKLSLETEDAYLPFMYTQEEDYRSIDHIKHQAEGLANSLARMFPRDIFYIEYCVDWVDNGEQISVDVSVEVREKTEDEVDLAFTLTDKGREMVEKLKVGVFYD